MKGTLVISAAPAVGFPLAEARAAVSGMLSGRVVDPFFGGRPRPIADRAAPADYRLDLAACRRTVIGAFQCSWTRGLLWNNA